MSNELITSKQIKPLPAFDHISLQYLIRLCETWMAYNYMDKSVLISPYVDPLLALAIESSD